MEIRLRRSPAVVLTDVPDGHRGTFDGPMRRPANPPRLDPTTIRATAAGFCYNFGRIASAAAPYTVGKVAETSGFGVAFAIAGAAFLLAAVAWIWIPETRNRELT